MPFPLSLSCDAYRLPRDSPPGDAADVQQHLSLATCRKSALLNQAACHLKLGANRDAISAADKVHGMLCVLVWPGISCLECQQNTSSCSARGGMQTSAR